MAIVNNVTRFLDSRKVRYTAFETPAEKLGAMETAQLLGLEPEAVFKTIVVTREKPKKPLLVVVPGPSSVDLKLLAAAVGEKKVHLPTEREAEQLTGLQAGGISPLALVNTTISGNQATEMGGVFVWGPVSATNVTISGNSH